MALSNKIGNLFKKAITFNPSVYQAIRCMSSSKLFVGGLSYGTDEQSLREAFTSYGEVVEARVIMDRETGRSRGFGFVTFTSGEEASAAITGMDGKDLHGRIVRVNYATDRTGFRGGYGGGYGGNSGGYGGSGGSYGVAGGGSGSDNYVGGAAGDNYVSGGGGAGGYGGSGSYGGSGTIGYGSSADGDQRSNNISSADAAQENGSQDDLLDDNYEDDNDQPDDYANKRG
ncbi:putative Glycine-rich RNA-binding protein 4, mitochondrial [Cocos nucifera]|uniref:Putative Glycine-rich RNA-binding protein 4, mitochondrial n=1 Tax=Cocos nucifera TaxID=13894 RepID=A0A8K0N1C7_COCNU|nr:putative Glycine-rich RNA-binding protein 4, mitochondrial [Cocos nucifera]